NHPFLHPTKSAYITMNNQIIGFIGQLHPQIAQSLKLSQVYLGSLNLSYLSTQVGQSNKYQKLSNVPMVNRDLSLVVPQSIKANELVKVVKQASSKLIKEVSIFDLYKGDKIAQDHYSISISIKIQDEKQTLKDEEISKIINDVINNLDKKLNITLRQS
ncbi:MAG: hypothetical protein ACRCTA_07700, partial [Bacilli bacterium]